jgi:hypothetical protein
MTAVKLHFMQQLLELNQAFENVIFGLERMEKAALFDKDQVRYARAEVAEARVDVYREFFDKFGEIVEKDSAWAYKFRLDRDRRSKDPFDLYLEVQEREEERKKNGLPPRAVLIPGWDQDDEPLFKERQTKKALGNRAKAANRPKTTRARATRKPRTVAHPRRRKDA